MKTTKWIATCVTALLITCYVSCTIMSVSKTQETKATLLKKADVILKSIALADFKSVSKSVHEDRGLQFSPHDQEELTWKRSRKYPMMRSNITMFTKKQIANFMQDKETYIWGNYSGTGFEIEQTPKLYYEEFIYDFDFLKKAKACPVDNDELKKKKELKYIYKTYPKSWLVQYHYEGTIENGFCDCRNIFLIFEYLESQWFLVSIVHG